MTDDVQSELPELISEISEEAFCAGWQGDIEYYLWDCLISERRDVGQVTLSEDQVDRLRRLSRAIGGWFYFTLTVHAPTFVTMSDWEVRFERWTEEEAERARRDER